MRVARARLRRALVFAVVLTIVQVLAVCGVALARRPTERRDFDAHLTALALDASQQLARDVAERAGAVARFSAARMHDALYVEVTDAHGRTLGNSSAELAALLPLVRESAPPLRAECSDVVAAALPESTDADDIVRAVALPFRDADGDIHVLHVVARTTGDAALLRDLLERLRWIAPLGLVTAFLVALALEREALRPVAAVAEAAAGLRAETLGRGLEVGPAEGEIGRLQAALNEALRRLESAFSAQSAFVANVSHELNTPIAVLLTQAQLLDVRRAAPDELAAFRASVESEMRRLGRTVEGFLVLARAEAHGEIERTEPVDVLDVVVDATQRVEPLAARRSVRVLPHAADDAAAGWCVRGARDLLCVLFENLVRNAVEVSPAGARVEIELTRDTNRVRVAVRDSGPGIADELLPHVFERFVQGPRASDGARDPQRLRRSGLGLHICATVARLHAARLDARNRESGGCEFVVTLPEAIETGEDVAPA